MVIAQFPPLESADHNGLLAVGGDLEVESLILAYRSGIFPWPVYQDGPIPWFAPPKRAVLFLKDFHVPRSLRRLRTKMTYSFAFNRDFSQVIRQCSSVGNRSEGERTWITPQVIAAYTELHRLGYCHSVECYDGSELIGGLYGVSIGLMFAGESMFHKQENASKLCLCALVDHLREREVEWIDCQQMTPLFESFGAVEIERAEFMKLLEPAVNTNVKLFN